jgi:hypothetical protein
MSLFQQTLANITKKAENKKAGKFNGIPYPFPRFAQFIPSIDPEQVIGLTSFSGVGKSRFLRNVFITYPYEFSLHNGYNLEIDYYALEDSAERIFKSILCNYLNRHCKERVSLYDLDSKFRELSSHILKLIREGERYLSDFNNKVRIKDSFTTPSAIKRDILTRASQLGDIQTVERDGQKYIVGYKPKTDVHHIVAFDNLNNVDKDPVHNTQKDAMDAFVSKDCRLVYSKILRMTCVVVHQQSLEAEKQQFTNTGGVILDKNKPSLANLGGTKEVTRSYHLVLSLFSPHKFKQLNYRGYDIGQLGNNFRELEVLKSNDGSDIVATPLYFDGTAENFIELPNSDKQKEELQRFYQWLQQERLKYQNKQLLF